MAPMTEVAQKFIGIKLAATLISGDDVCKEHRHNSKVQCDWSHGQSSHNLPCNLTDRETTWLPWHAGDATGPNHFTAGVSAGLERTRTLFPYYLYNWPTDKQNCFSTQFYKPYNNVTTSAQNAQKCSQCTNSTCVFYCSDLLKYLGARWCGHETVAHHPAGHQQRRMRCSLQLTLHGVCSVRQHWGEPDKLLLFMAVYSSTEMSWSHTGSWHVMLITVQEVFS